MIIRGMAVGEVEPADILKVKRKETAGMLCGLSLALVNFCSPDDPVSGQVLICL